MNGVGVGTEEKSTLNAEIWCEHTLDSDDGVGRYLSSERGSTGVESSLRC